MALPFLPSGEPLTQNTHICTQPYTLTHIHTEILLRRGLHYTGITKRNVLIKLCRQLQTARRENGNDVVHQAFKENTSRGLCMCVCVMVCLCVHVASCLCPTCPAVEDMRFLIRAHRDRRPLSRDYRLISHLYF